MAKEKIKEGMTTFNEREDAWFAMMEQIPPFSLL